MILDKGPDNLPNLPAADALDIALAKLEYTLVVLPSAEIPLDPTRADAIKAAPSIASSNQNL